MQQAAILDLPTYLTVVGEQVSAIAYSVPCLIHLGDAAGNKGFIAIGDWIRPIKAS